MPESQSLLVENPWGERSQVFSDKMIREYMRNKAISIVEDIGVRVSAGLMSVAPDQVLSKLVSASEGQVAGILTIEANIMIAEVVKEREDQYHGPKYYERLAIMRRGPLPVLSLDDPKAFIRNELDGLD